MRNVPVRLLILSLFVSGLCQCSYFKIFRNDIRQGNAIEEGNLNKLYKGMPKSQVSKIMGTPALIPRLDTDKWVYTYYLIPGDDKPREEKKLAAEAAVKKYDARVNMDSSFLAQFNRGNGPSM